MATVPGKMPEHPARATAAMRIVLVEWRIRKGHEDEFLDYWSSRATVRDRTGLIGEFLSCVEDPNEYPWMIWELDERWTTFVNVGLWRQGADFQEQIGRFIDDTRPLMTFEAERRRRVFVAPERWRMGGTVLPASEHMHVN
jgi:heme-degrading monooxygenase HmoA